MQNLSLLYLEMHINDKKICKAESWKVLIFWEKKNKKMKTCVQQNKVIETISITKHNPCFLVICFQLSVPVPI